MVLVLSNRFVVGRMLSVRGCGVFSFSVAACKVNFDSKKGCIGTVCN